MGATMRGMGPACCCCNDIWPIYARQQFRLHEDKAAEVQFDADDSGTARGNGDFDHVHKKQLYLQAGGAGISAVYLKNDFVLNRAFTNNDFAPTVIACCDPDNEQIIDVSHQDDGSGNDEIVFHKYNYDGTGDTAFLTLPLLDSPDYYREVLALHYNRTTGTVFAWMFRGSTAGTSNSSTPSPTQTYFEILEIDLLGNPPAVIHNFPTKQHGSFANQYIGGIRILEIDYTNSKLWWEIQEVTTSGATTFDRNIQRSDFDGSNLETMLSETQPFTYTHLGWQYSHKDNCFWLSTWDSTIPDPLNDPTNGLWRVEPDWSSKELIYPRSVMEIAPAFFRLGCVFETTGAGSPA